MSVARIAAVVAIVVFSLPLVAQEMREEITVDVVEVPVYVTSYSGNPVAGLKREQFELYVNGELHPIDAFDEIVESGDDVDEHRTPDLQRRRMFVLLFDLTYSSPLAVARSKEAALALLPNAQPSDTFAVATLTRGGVAVIVPFTTDRAPVQRAISTLRPSAARDAFNLAMLSSERIESRAALEQATRLSHSADASWRIDGRLIGTVVGEADLLNAAPDAPIAGDDLRYGSLAHLGDFAERLAAISGIKQVIFLSEGRVIGAGGFEATQYLMQMHRRFRRAGVILDAAATGLPDAPWSADEKLWTPEPLYSLALDTGGTVATHARAVDALQALYRKHSVTYVLAFRPPPSKRLHNDIRVRIHGAPLLTRVQHRRGYSTAMPEGAETDGLFLADVLLNDIPQHGITLDLDVERDGREAVVEARIPGAELLAQMPKRNVTLDVFFYVFDEQNAVAAWGHTRAVVDLEKGRDFLAGHPYAMKQRFNLGPGKYAAKALVRFVETGASGFRRSDFSVVESVGTH